MTLWVPHVPLYTECHTDPVSNGANIAQLLREDDVGFQSVEQRLVKSITRARGMERFTHPVVDYQTWRPRLVNRTVGHSWLGIHFGLLVAFVRDPDQAIELPQDTDHLGGGWQEGDDAQNVPSLHAEAD